MITILIYLFTPIKTIGLMMELEILLNNLKKKLEGSDDTKGINGIKNTGFHRKDQEDYKNVPVFSLDIASPAFQDNYDAIFKRFRTKYLSEIRDLSIIYATPNSLDPLHKEIRVYIKKRNDEEKEEVLKYLIKDFIGYLDKFKFWIRARENLSEETKKKRTEKYEKRQSQKSSVQRNLKNP
jgi:hypothetical protein